jgi:hypothetical protein
VTYRVPVTVIVTKAGYIDVPANSEHEAQTIAKELAALPGKVVKQPEWSVEDVDIRVGKAVAA